MAYSRDKTERKEITSYTGLIFPTFRTETSSNFPRKNLPKNREEFCGNLSSILLRVFCGKLRVFVGSYVFFVGSYVFFVGAVFCIFL